MSTGYREIKQLLLARLRSGEWPAGSIMPREVQLAEEYGCARVTVNRAIRELADEGIVRRQRRRGTEVLGDRSRRARLTIRQARQQIEAQGQTYDYRCLGQRSIAATRQAATRLGVAVGAPLRFIAGLHQADSQAFQYEQRWINLRSVPEAADFDFSAMPPGEWLMQVKPLTEAEHRLRATGASADVARHLHQPPGAPVFVMERCTWWQGQSVTWARLYHPGDAFELLFRDGEERPSG